MARENERALVEPPVGIAMRFGSLAEASPLESASCREQDARQLLSWLSKWIPAYARSVFAAERTHWQSADWQAFEQDVIQHTLLACIRRGAARWADTTDDHALRWIRNVVRNFLISQGARWRSRRQALTLAPPICEATEPAIHLQDGFFKLVDLMRREIASLVRPRDVDLAEHLFDELVRSVLSSYVGSDVKSSDARARSRMRQRRRRGRQLASRAYERLAASMASEAAKRDLALVAAVLGIEIRPSPSDTSRLSCSRLATSC